MRTARCPACSAAVPESADWCSLCYTDLRVRETVPATGSVAAAGSTPVDHPASAVAVDPLTAPLETLLAPAAEATGDDLPANAATAASSAPTSVGREPRWPCPNCGASNDMALDHCEACGAGFLDGGKPLSLSLPVVGDLTTMSAAHRLLVGIGIAVVVAAVLVVLFTIGGHIF